MNAQEARKLVYSCKDDNDLYVRAQKAIAEAVEEGTFSAEMPYDEDEDGTTGLDLLRMDGFTINVWTRAGKINLTVAWKP